MATLPDGGSGWNVYPVCFARSGFTHDAKHLAEQHNVMLVDLKQIDGDLITSI